MLYRIISLIVFVGFLLPISSFGYNGADSTKVFTEADYLDWVRRYHPVVQRANLLSPVADAYRLKARGGFEPKFDGSVNRKSFDGKTYYTLVESGFKIPTWLGAEVKAGYEWTNGIFLNPENNFPSAGQAFVGVKWALARGLQIDERRATLEKANILAEANEAERREIVNDILLKAGKAYWDWATAYNNLQIQQEALELAQVRLVGTVNSFIQGDKPAIDTLETMIQVQDREIAVNDARVEYENSSRILSNFLWYENELPIEVSDLLRPPYYLEVPLIESDVNLDETLASLRDNHPTLVLYRAKLQQLEVDRRLKKEQLKPQVDVEVNLLANGLDFVNRQAPDENGFNTLLTENYKAGLVVSYPIFRRKARGDLELADLKLLDTNHQLRQKAQDLKNKIINYQIALDNSRTQVDISEVAVDNYERLLYAENEKFRFGESSIFLLNSREQKLIDAQLKLVKQVATYRKNRLGLLWSAGQL